MVGSATQRHERAFPRVQPGNERAYLAISAASCVAIVGTSPAELRETTLETSFEGERLHAEADRDRSEVRRAEMEH